MRTRSPTFQPLTDLAGCVGAGDPRHRHRQAGHATPHEDVEIVQSDCLAADQNVARPDDRIRELAVDDVLDAALLLDDCSFHHIPRMATAPESSSSFAPIETFHSACQRRAPAIKATI
jgi:hypothetical protein